MLYFLHVAFTQIALLSIGHLHIQPHYNDTKLVGNLKNSHFKKPRAEARFVELQLETQNTSLYIHSLERLKGDLLHQQL